MSNRFEKVEKQSEILKKVAAAYAAESQEQSAVRLAAFALLFVTMKHAEEFEEWLQANKED